MNQHKYFVIVKFEDTQEVEVTSSTWLRNNNTRCVWPNYRSSNKTVKAVSNHEFIKKDWKEYKIKILGQGHQFALYNDAVAKLPKFLEESDVELTSDVETTKKRACRKVNKARDVDSGSSDEEIQQAVKLPPPPSFKLVLVNPDNIGSTPSAHGSQINSPANLIIEGSETPEVMDDDVNNEGGGSEIHVRVEQERIGPSSPFHPSSSRNVKEKDFQDWVVRNITIIKAQIRQVQEGVDTIILQLGDQQDKSGQLQSSTQVHQIPLKSKDDVGKLGQFYENKDNRDSLVKELGNRARGKKLAKVCRRVLSLLLDNSVAVEYNWIGSRGSKAGFRDTWMKDIVFDSVRSGFTGKSAAEEEIEETVKEWLKMTSRRLHPKASMSVGSDRRDDCVNDEDGNYD